MPGRMARWGLLAVGLVGAATIQQLKRPAAERTWRGRLFGLIPYDFRPPTRARLQAEVWNPADSRILTPHAFGVGWGINVYQVKEQLRASLAR
jgi:hypothetical protein